MIGGLRLWPGVFVGAFAANVLTDAPVAVALGIGAGNSLEAVAGAYALTRIPGFRLSLDRLVDVFVFIGLAALLSTAISATVGVTSLYLGGIVAPGHAGETWRAWWLGDVIGALLVTPLLLTWYARHDIPRYRMMEIGWGRQLQRIRRSVPLLSCHDLGSCPFRAAGVGDGDIRSIRNCRGGHCA